MPVLYFIIHTEPKPKKRPKVYRWATVNPSEADEKELATLVQAMPNCPQTPMSGQVRVSFKFYKTPPKNTPQWQLPLMENGLLRPNKSPDLDNYVKFALDALNGIIWEDDRFIVEMHSVKLYSLDNPRIEIQVEEIVPPKKKSEAQDFLDNRSHELDLEVYFGDDTT